MKVTQVEFVERLRWEPGDASFDEILTGTLRRFALDAAGLIGPVRVSLVRRLSVSEIVCLRLEPARGPWYELRATAISRVSQRTARAGARMSVGTSAVRRRAVTRF